MLGKRIWNYEDDEDDGDLVEPKRMVPEPDNIGFSLARSRFESYPTLIRETKGIPIIDKCGLSSFAKMKRTCKLMEAILLKRQKFRKIFEVAVTVTLDHLGGLVFTSDRPNAWPSAYQLKYIMEIPVQVVITRLTFDSQMSDAHLAEIDSTLINVRVIKIKELKIRSQINCWNGIPAFMNKFKVEELCVQDDHDDFAFYINMPEIAMKEIFDDRVPLVKNIEYSGEVFEDAVIKSTIPDMLLSFSDALSLECLKSIMQRWLTEDGLSRGVLESDQLAVPLRQLFEGMEVIDFYHNGPLPSTRPLYVEGTRPARNARPTARDEYFFLLRRDQKIVVIQRGLRIVGDFVGHNFIFSLYDHQYNEVVIHPALSDYV